MTEALFKRCCVIVFIYGCVIRDVLSTFINVNKPRCTIRLVIDFLSSSDSIMMQSLLSSSVVLVLSKMDVRSLTSSSLSFDAWSLAASSSSIGSVSSPSAS